MILIARLALTFFITAVVSIVSALILEDTEFDIAGMILLLVFCGSILGLVVCGVIAIWTLA